MMSDIIAYLIAVLLLVFAAAIGMAAGEGMGNAAGKQTACASVNLEWVEPAKACMKVTRENLK